MESKHALASRGTSLEKPLHSLVCVIVRSNIADNLFSTDVSLVNVSSMGRMPINGAKEAILPGKIFSKAARSYKSLAVALAPRYRIFLATISSGLSL
jgi:hypothetical protein